MQDKRLICLESERRRIEDIIIQAAFEGKPVRVYYDEELKRINAKIIEGHLYEPRF